jgi:hypothetical protein
MDKRGWEVGYSCPGRSTATTKSIQAHLIAWLEDVFNVSERRQTVPSHFCLLVDLLHSFGL